MLEKFLLYIKENLSDSDTNNILLSVSGGIDSMVMVRLCHLANLKFGIAHINHDTREGESDKDAEFVQNYCIKNSISFHEKKLNYKNLSEGNFQENARAARKDFLKQVADNENYSCIFTAHHMDDRLETLLMNLDRKSGIKGLIGFPSYAPPFFKALLPFSKEEIIHFASNNNVDFKVDKSNYSDAYRRNRIRHHIIPILNAEFNNFTTHSAASMNHLAQDYTLLEELIDELNLVEKGDLYNVIHLDKIKALTNGKTLLYHVLDRYNFNYQTTEDIYNSSNTGSLFYSSDYESLLNRDKLLIRPLKNPLIVDLSIHEPGEYKLTNGRKIRVYLSNEASENSNSLSYDKTTVKWPIRMRNIQPGDIFHPINLKGKSKKVKKLCSDLKISRFDKENLIVLEVENEIIGILGLGYDFFHQPIKKDDFLIFEYS